MESSKPVVEPTLYNQVKKVNTAGKKGIEFEYDSKSLKTYLIVREDFLQRIPCESLRLGFKGMIDDFNTTMDAMPKGMRDELIETIKEKEKDSK